MRIVVEAIDEQTRCIADDAVIEVDPSVFGTELPDNMFAWDDELSGGARNHLKSICNVARNAKTFCIRTPGRIDSLGYKVHTGRELALMLSGTKPMAMFYYVDGETFEDICDQPFDKYVERGDLQQHDFSIDDAGRPDATIHYRVFTLPAEAWRANALQLLKRVARSCKWSEGMERLEGSLLGYTEAQNDEFIERLFRKRD
jgi:hypothetical protein